MSCGMSGFLMQERFDRLDVDLMAENSNGDRFGSQQVLGADVIVPRDRQASFIGTIPFCSRSAWIKGPSLLCRRAFEL